jgi:hypothetical protein
MQPALASVNIVAQAHFLSSIGPSLSFEPCILYQGPAKSGSFSNDPIPEFLLPEKET